MHVEISTLMSELHGAGERGHCGRVVLAIEGNVRVDETRHEFDEGAAHPFSQGEQMRQLLARFLFCTRLMQRQGRQRQAYRFVPGPTRLHELKR